MVFIPKCQLLYIGWVHLLPLVFQISGVQLECVPHLCYLSVWLDPSLLEGTYLTGVLVRPCPIVLDPLRRRDTLGFSPHDLSLTSGGSRLPHSILRCTYLVLSRASSQSSGIPRPSHLPFRHYLLQSVANYLLLSFPNDGQFAAIRVLALTEGHGVLH